MQYEVSFSLNGSTVSVRAGATTTLLDALREQLGVTSPKRGCESGDCGACTVLLDGRAVNACLTLALAARGRQVSTAEGLGAPGRLHPLQEAFVELGASQCGFCTPGMLMAAKAFLDQNRQPTREQIAGGISGNLCRCTGYVKIVDAIAAAARRLADDPPGQGVSR